jgi:hypothetical protein
MDLIRSIIYILNLNNEKMKKMLLNFAENLISKEQMSKIKGGCSSEIVCQVEVSYPGGYYISTGQCGSSNLAECQSYQPPCPTGSCSMTCDYYYG